MAFTTSILGRWLRDNGAWFESGSGLDVCCRSDSLNGDPGLNRPGSPFKEFDLVVQNMTVALPKNETKPLQVFLMQ